MSRTRFRPSARLASAQSPLSLWPFQIPMSQTGAPDSVSPCSAATFEIEIS